VHLQYYYIMNLQQYVSWKTRKCVQIKSRMVHVFIARNESEQKTAGCRLMIIYMRRARAVGIVRYSKIAPF
jgi:hypothetical protein